MNRNQEAHFSELPNVEVSRSRFDRSSSVKFSADAGDLIPFYVDEVLPGDTFSIDTAKVVRMQTLLYPIMDNVYLDTYWFYVPNRLVWSHWKNFMGETTDAWRDSGVSYSVPEIKAYGTGWLGTALDYMGIPAQRMDQANANGTTDAFYFNALPWRGYQLIWNDWFRDENLQDSLVIATGDAMVSASSGTAYKCLKANKFHDYFSSCLPNSQRGDAVPFLTGRLPVATGPDSVYPRSLIDDPYSANGFKSIQHYPLWWDRTSGNVANAHDFWSRIERGTNSGSTATANYFSRSSTSAGFTAANKLADNNTGDYPVPTNLFAFLDQKTGASVGISANAFMVSNTINSLRFAFQLQKFLEKDARGGTRYIELLKSHFGVTSPDARMQRPEYLGGNRISLNINQVVNQAEQSGQYLGNLGAMSHTVDNHSDFTHSFTEHGFLFGLCVVRYDHSYQQGFERFWLRRNRYDYYWPVFANIGEQPVFRYEIYADPSDYGSARSSSDPLQIPKWDFNTVDRNTSPTFQSEWSLTQYSGINAPGVFGFQEAWADYRYKPNRIAGELRSGLSNTLDFWHLGDYYSSSPSLSSAWIAEDKANIDRVLAVTSSVSNQFLFDFYVKNTCTRCMPLYSIPGLIDHH